MPWASLTVAFGAKPGLSCPAIPSGTRAAGESSEWAHHGGKWNMPIRRLSACSQGLRNELFRRDMLFPFIWTALEQAYRKVVVLRICAIAEMGHKRYLWKGSLEMKIGVCHSSILKLQKDLENLVIMRVGSTRVRWPILATLFAWCRALYDQLMK